jgi:hypothetical protein
MNFDERLSFIKQGLNLALGGTTRKLLEFNKRSKQFMTD